MAYASNAMSGRSLRIKLGVFITVLAAFILTSLPAKADISINSSPINISSGLQVAQLQLCLPPKRIINGRCQLPGLVQPRQIQPGLVQRCRPPKRLIGGRCQLPQLRPVCRPPKRLVRGVCKLPQLRPVCAPPKRLIGGRCQLPQLRPVCRPPKRMIRGVCKLPQLRPVCRPPKRLIRGVCKLPQLRPVCAPPKRMIRGVCKLPQLRPVCRLPKVLVRGRCRLPDLRPVCRLPRRMIGGVCKLPPIVNPCLPPDRLVAGVCRPPIADRCLRPRRWINGVCRLPDVMRCERPRVWRGGRCVLPNPRCLPPLVRSPISGRCYMPFDIDPIPEAECRAPWFFSPEAGGCVKPRPRPRPQENIVWIQSCLNSLGYSAGVEDGLAGRNTRAAWESFRDALGLSGYVDFVDPETLSLLYRQCRPQPAQPLPPGPQCPAPAAGGGCSSGLEYRPVLCATGRLFNLLSDNYGGSIDLEKCGRSCLPVPDGMDEAEALRLQSEQGITWCKDCVKVGEEGILCPTPRLLNGPAPLADDVPQD